MFLQADRRIQRRFDVEADILPLQALDIAAFVNALVGAINALYKTELIRARGAWRPARESNSQPWNVCGGGTTSASTPSSTTEPRSRPNLHTTLRPNRSSKRLFPRRTLRNEAQSDSKECACCPSTHGKIRLWSPAFSGGALRSPHIVKPRLQILWRR